MRQAHTYRWHRKAVACSLEEPLRPGPIQKVGVGRRIDWLRKHPKLAPFYGPALLMLKTGDRATPPTWRAIKKMMVAIAVSPRIKPIGQQQKFPAIVLLGRHQRGSWRELPHKTIDANLQVAS